MLDVSAFETIRELKTVERRRREQRSVCERKDLVWANVGLEVERGSSYAQNLHGKRKLLHRLSVGYRRTSLGVGTKHVLECN